MSFRHAVVVAFLLSAVSASAATFTVTNTNDSGAGSLRQAILDANAAGSASTVTFNITSSSKLITLLSALPTAGATVTVDGTTQPGYSGHPLVEIDGTNAPGASIECVGTTGGVLKALAIGGCQGTAVTLRGGTLTLSYVGLDATGTQQRPNATGVRVSSSPNGGSAPVVNGNVVAASSGAGVYIAAPNAVVTGNRIGLDGSGERSMPNGTGISLQGSAGVTITSNTICSNQTGIDVSSSDSTTISTNSIGVTAGGRTLANSIGISVYQSNGCQIGPNTIVSGNKGIVVTGSSIRNVIRVNKISTLGGPAIDLGDDFITPNDVGDNDVGPNNLQNYPSGLRARPDSNATIVTGTLNSKPSQQYLVDLYANQSCSSYPQAETWIHALYVTTDATGNGTFSEIVAPALPPGTAITATATDSFGNTSELAPCVFVEGPGTLRFNSSATNVGEGSSSAILTVNRLGGATGVVTVAYATASGTATAGADFAATTGTLTFADGQTSATISVPILQDSIYEGPESFTVTLAYPTGGANLGEPSVMTVTIADDDSPVAAAAEDVRIVEGDAGQRSAFIVITAPSPISGTVSYSTTDGTAKAGSDYVAATGSVSFANETTKTIAIPIIGDGIVEPDETFTVGLTATGSFTLSRSSVTVTIANDDAGISTTPLTIAPGSTGNIAVDVGSSSAQTLTVTSSNSDIASVPATVSINGAGSVPVTGKSSGHATITVTLPASLGGASTRVEVDVFEPAHLVLTPDTVRIPVAGSATVSARFDPALSATETVALSSVGSGKIAMPESITIPAGAASSTFTINGVEAGHRLILATLSPTHGSTLSSVDVTVLDATPQPSLSSVSPANGPTAGGTNVTVTGSNLRSDCSVRFGGAAAPNVVFGGATSMTATTPAHAAGAADVSISCGTDNFTLSNAFTYLGAAPHLSGATPSFGNSAGGTVVNITGDSLISGCWPFFDGVAARSANVVDATRLVASAPPHPAAIDVTILVRCNGSAPATLEKAFTYTTNDEPSPVIRSVNPLSGAAGLPVTVSGARFRDTDVVTFDGVRATMLATDFESHVVRIPDVPAGKVSVTVTDTAGHASTSGPVFTILQAQPPQISAATPRSVRPLNEVVLDGSGFRPGFSFTIGGETASVLDLSYTRVTLRVPALAAATYDVRVLDAAGGVAAVGPPLTVLAAGLDVQHVSPLCTTNAGGALMTIVGDGFGSEATVTIGGAAASGVTFIDAHTLTLPLPAAIATGWPTIVVKNANGDAASLTRGFMTVSPFDPNGCRRARPSRR